MSIFRGFRENGLISYVFNELAIVTRFESGSNGTMRFRVLLDLLAKCDSVGLTEPEVPL